MHAVARYGPLVGLVVLLLAPLNSSWAVTAGVGEILGDRAPPIHLPSIDSDDDPIQLADYRGRIVFLDFWSSWCGPCRRAMPHLDALRQALPRAEFEVIAVNVDPLIEDGRRYLRKSPVSYPVAVDPAGEVVRRYGVDVLPAWFVIDGRGVVRRAEQGKAAEDLAGLMKLFEQLVEEDGIEQ